MNGILGQYLKKIYVGSLGVLLHIYGKKKSLTLNGSEKRIFIFHILVSIISHRKTNCYGSTVWEQHFT